MGKEDIIIESEHPAHPIMEFYDSLPDDGKEEFLNFLDYLKYKYSL